MKRILPLITLLTTLISCNITNDDGVPPPNFDVIGLWDLTEINVNPAQDINEDGMASTNLLDELDCISGELLIDGDLLWSLEQTSLQVTTITNGQFNVACSGNVVANGEWFSDENEITFEDNPEFSALQIENGTLVLNLGEDLPGFQSFMYTLRQ
ncbi:hypothetical protein MTsPCn9_06560 [Croceitalea sp. MTPC9]|uniref:hypothetical protein n=1 Tax=unclassified Croceitalea TaxID=2632280 RepID=UPI002B3ED256|nr:hypothetical protein MTsPCn6_02150 [Croceitalea sp. MTPC6]GMN15720.1 hypothetical protein MTsPCn9_06560 [Croceitalea sp. MTPC9]